ncbi:MAG: DegT/DnrJ/EryC1/StrS family aminotransferase [Thermoleophilia bacterium]
MEVPCIDLAVAYQGLKAELDEAVARVMASGIYVLGENLAAFEQEFAGWIGTAAAAATGSGTDAIYLTLKALGIGAGDEVITVSHTAVNTAMAIVKAGATPVFIDIDPETYCMEPALLKAALTGRTRAVMPVHLYGHPVDMEPVMEFAAGRGLAVIEDCAQAHGATCRGRTVGTFGVAGCFSFYPTKNLGACGDGGAVVTADPELAARIRSLANCGQGSERYLNIYRGDVSRLDELQAAMLRVRLRHLHEFNHRRREIAYYYEQALVAAGLTPAVRSAGGGLAAGIVPPAERDWARHVYHLYVIRSKERDRLRAHLEAAGVRTMVHYPRPAHQQPAFADLLRAPLPVTEQVVSEILSLPLYPELDDARLEQVARALKSFAA